MSKTDRAVLVIPEAAGKRIRQLSLAEPFANSHNIYVSIEFDDRTEVLIEVESRPYFSIMHLVRDSRGDTEPVRNAIHGTLRSLVKARK